MAEQMVKASDSTTMGELRALCAKQTGDAQTVVAQVEPGTSRRSHTR